MNNKKVKHKISIFLVLILVGYIFINISVTVLSYKTRSGYDISQKIDDITTVEKKISAERGKIFDTRNRELVKNAKEYDLYVIVSDTYPEKVTDKKRLISELSFILKISPEEISKSIENTDLFQVSLGKNSKNLTQEQKTRISDLNITGILFEESPKRIYNNDSLLSPIIGYIRETENNQYGETGIEEKYNDELSGSDGTLKYVANKEGQKINGTIEQTIPKENGANIYLTVNQDLQSVAEKIQEDALKEVNPEWMQTIVMDADTGELLVTASSPTFNLNTLENISDYTSPMYSKKYEPGSIFKIFTWFEGIKNPEYNGNAKFLSGKIKVADMEIADFNKVGWGQITYDEGFHVSSNVGAFQVINNYSNYDKFYDTIMNFGFTSELSKLNLPNEDKGNISYNYIPEKASVTFGQGIQTTGFQVARAFSAIVNNSGKVVEPYVVKSVVDENNKTYINNEKTTYFKDEQIVSSEQRKKMIELMDGVLRSPNQELASGKAYNLTDVKVYGKTGTGQQINEYGKYDFETKNLVYSFLSYLPTSEKNYIIYNAVGKPKNTSFSHDAYASKYYKRFVSYFNEYINKNTSDTTFEQTNTKRKMIIGNESDQIIKMINLTETNLEIIYTTEKNLAPDFKNISKVEASRICDIINIDCFIVGEGYGVEQSIPKNQEILENQKIEIKFAR